VPLQTTAACDRRHPHSEPTTLTHDAALPGENTPQLSLRPAHGAFAHADRVDSDSDGFNTPSDYWLTNRRTSMIGIVLNRVRHSQTARQVGDTQ